MTTVRPARPHRTSGVWRSSCGIGRSSRRLRNVETPVSYARERRPRWNARAISRSGSISETLMSGRRVA